MRPRIVIGAGRPNMLAAFVCEFSIRKYCPEAEIIHTFHRPFIKGEDNTLHRDRWSEICNWIPTPIPMGTMFSFCRHMVPEICDFQGEAIYLDSDQIVFADIRELWEIPFGGAALLRMEDGQFSVLKMDCAKLAPYTIKALLTGGWSYRQVMNGLYLPPGMLRHAIPNVWNCLDKFHGGTKLLHYTRMLTQPWVVPGHPWGFKWFDLLAEAVEAGFIELSPVQEEIREQDRSKTWQAAMWPQPHVLEELRRRL